MARLLRIAFIALAMVGVATIIDQPWFVARAAAGLEIFCIHGGDPRKVFIGPGQPYQVCDRCATPFCYFHAGPHRNADPSTSCTGWLKILTAPK
jgi:hypothetical protein